MFSVRKYYHIKYSEEECPYPHLSFPHQIFPILSFSYQWQLICKSGWGFLWKTISSETFLVWFATFFHHQLAYSMQPHNLFPAFLKVSVVHFDPWLQACFTAWLKVQKVPARHFLSESFIFILFYGYWFCIFLLFQFRSFFHFLYSLWMKVC